MTDNTVYTSQAVLPGTYGDGNTFINCFFSPGVILGDGNVLVNCTVAPLSVFGEANVFENTTLVGDVVPPNVFGESCVFSDSTVVNAIIGAHYTLSGTTKVNVTFLGSGCENCGGREEGQSSEVQECCNSVATTPDGVITRIECASACA